MAHIPTRNFDISVLACRDRSLGVFQCRSGIFTHPYSYLESQFPA